MTIKQTIEKAIEGGWKNLGTGLDLKNNPPDRYFTDADINSALLDPSFWQFLGKSMGWDKHDWIGIRYTTCDTCGVPRSGFGQPIHVGDKIKVPKKCIKWKLKWHKLIDHLARKGTPESYFKEIK